ncbi:MAG: alpha-mannosidase, partial [Candidatus Eisenbacteria bacterium]|nr:alpha-mannosidase [Candidatus Eisenbacteria bacterium]
MPHNTLHMVCNSHIDPVWLWDWEEGAAVTLATFRTAADLCEEFGNLIFCHNEAILYKYVEEYEPALFKRIRRLVRAKQWHIMGGWYLQPDCNMPSGESFVRQILLGKRYFREKFGVDVTTAMNFDPFGHSRGLVQILAKSGYDSYIYCRPGWSDGAAPAPIFDWVGFDGSEIRAVLATAHYNSPPGGAAARTAQWIQTQSYQAHHLQDVPPASPSGGALQRVSLLLWGVGNHGGGPSRRDLGDLAMLIRRSTATKVDHSTPEAFFKDHRRAYPSVPRHDGDLNPWAVGCYTSMIRVKQKHRELENTLYMTEKMAAAASLQKLTEYPRSALREAGCDLAVSEFHDALPGTSIQSVEDATLRILDHGLEILSRVKARAFFALAAGQRRAREGEYPILIYNHHPYRTECVVECELQPNWPHCTDRFMQA